MFLGMLGGHLPVFLANFGLFQHLYESLRETLIASRPGDAGTADAETGEQLQKSPFGKNQSAIVEFLQS